MIYLLRKLLASNLVWRLAKDNPHGKEILQNGELYMERKTFGTWFGKEYRLHRIYLPDKGRALHDHPFVFRSHILSGGYVHTVKRYKNGRPLAYLYEEGTSHFVGDLAFHRIEKIVPAKGKRYVATLVVARWTGKSWGFLDEDGTYTHYKKYQGQ